MTTSKNIPSPLHTRHLSSSAQAYCKQNPLYATRLAALQSLQYELHQVHRMIATREAGKLSTSSKVEAEPLESSVTSEIRETLEASEALMVEWDAELAALAEALLGRPKVCILSVDHCWVRSALLNEQFDIGDEVRFMDGQWWWALPKG